MPDSWFPLKLRTANEGITFEGEASGVGGGGAAVEGDYSGNAVTITDGNSAILTWDTLAGGTDLLDRSVPASPTFRAAGTYAVTVFFGGDALTAAGYAVGTISSGSFFAAGAYTQAPSFDWSAAGVFIAAPGDGLFATVTNKDGAVSRDFSIVQAVVVKL